MELANRSRTKFDSARVHNLGDEHLNTSWGIVVVVVD